jgi:hypothetical protein
MTENNKVSAIAFSVLVLGMLGFCVALAADLFLSPSAPPAVPPPTPTLPQELQNSVMQGRMRNPEGVYQNFQFNLMGRGQVLPEERTQRVEEVICYHLTFEHASPTLAGSRSQRMGDKGRMIDWGLDWTVVKESLIAQRAGDTWTSSLAGVAESDWLEHSCPGRYVSDTIALKRDANAKYVLINQD